MRGAATPPSLELPLLYWNFSPLGFLNALAFATKLRAFAIWAFN